MSDEHRFERDARAWLELGPTDAPDRVVEAALLEIDQTSQERDLRVPWRTPRMNRITLAAAALVAAVIVIIGGSSLLRPASGPGTSPSTSPSATPTSTSTANTGATPIPTGLGTWLLFEHFGKAPDGSSTTAFDGDYRTLWLAHLDGTNLHELAPGTPVDGKSSPAISPDGTKVLFASWKKTLIWEVNLDGTGLRQISTDCDGDFTPCGEDEPAYAPDGRRIVFSRTTDALATTGLAIRDLDTGAMTPLPATAVDGSVGFVSQPAWSPDGSMIAYTVIDQTAADERYTDAHLFVVNADGTGVHEVEDSPYGGAGDPAWSPDSSTIAFSTCPLRQTEGISCTGYILQVNPDGTGLKELCASCLDGGWGPSWAPDGEHILFYGYRTWGVMDADGSNPVHIDPNGLAWYGDRLGYGYVGFLVP